MTSDVQSSSNDSARPEGPVLVVGGAGYVGSHTVRMLEERGVPVVVLDDLSTGHRQSVRSPLVEASLSDRSALASTFETWQPRAVMHFAARSLVGESVENPSLYYRENVINAWNLLEEMRRVGCLELVFSSTCAIYGVPVALPLTEENPRAPVSPYGRSKLSMEHMMEDYSRAYGLRFACLRYFNAAGAAAEGDLGEVHESESHLIPLVLQVASGQREFISIFGNDYPTPDGTCVRDYIHIVDLADAHLRSLKLLQGGERHIACNLGTGQGYSVQEVIEAVRRVTGHPIPMRRAGRRPGDPPELISGGSVARDLLSWTPTRSTLDSIVQDAWRFHQSHPKGYAD